MTCCGGKGGAGRSTDFRQPRQYTLGHNPARRAARFPIREESSPHRGSRADSNPKRGDVIAECEKNIGWPAFVHPPFTLNRLFGHPYNAAGTVQRHGDHTKARGMGQARPIGRRNPRRARKSLAKSGGPHVDERSESARGWCRSRRHGRGRDSHCLDLPRQGIRKNEPAAEQHAGPSNTRSRETRGSIRRRRVREPENQDCSRP